MEELQDKLLEAEGELDIALASLYARSGPNDSRGVLDRVQANLSKGLYDSLSKMGPSGGGVAGRNMSKGQKTLTNMMMVGPVAWDPLPSKSFRIPTPSPFSLSWYPPPPF